ncbi:Pentalenene oxygenase [Alphaproteobacteria bacterium SO-S41]|nr:Pentalenene oxygenase [Alphaproteobacteria bacterium SO-S41]
MSGAGSAASVRRDPKRPAAPVPLPPVPNPGFGDMVRFFLRARKNLISAFDESVYREAFIRRKAFGSDIWIVSEPEAIKRVLLDNFANYPKGIQQQRRLTPALGEGLLTSEGESWRWQRRTTAPAFQHKRVVGFAPAMVAAANDLLARWDSEGTAERDIAAETMQLTFDVLSRTVFGSDARTDAKRMGAAFELYFDTAGRLDIAGMLNLPDWVPTLGRLRARPALRYFQSEIGRIVRDRRALIARDPAAAPDDLLTMLLTAEDPEGGRPMDERQVIDNALTFIGAGHETTANALNWVFYLLAAYPWAEERVVDEIGRVLNGRAPGAEDVGKLTYTRQVLDEALRLYPPAPFMGRVALAADELGGEKLKAGTQVLVSPWVLHRHHMLWDEPELFDPERFAPGRKETIHRFAYLPFGGGPRICIGMAFAVQEAMLLLVTILQRYRLTVREGFTVGPNATITLRPEGGLPMRVERRH